MNGSAPNSPETGSHVVPVQKPKPNFVIDSIDCRESSTASATTVSTTNAAKAPVKARNHLSSRERFMKG